MDTVRIYARDSVATLRGAGPPSLNWLYLVEWVAIAILVVFYFFYLNRLVGIVVSFILRALFWRKSNTYIDIGGISFSLLGGEIIFSDVRYLSRNQSLRVVRGHVVWRYWLRRVRSREDKETERDLPCRLSVSLHGAEWFLYNRTPSYDDILTQLGVVHPDFDRDPQSNSSKDDLLKTDSSGKTESHSSAGSPAAAANNPTRLDAPIEAAKASIDWYKESLPIEIKCKTGSITMGNPSTPTIIIAGFEQVEGVHTAVKSRSDFDDYKQIYHLTFTQSKIVYRTNPDYDRSMLEHGESVGQRLSRDVPGVSYFDFFHRPRHFLSLDTYRNLLRRQPKLTKKERAKQDQVKSEDKDNEKDDWAGLPRYQATAPGDLPHRVEYAKVTTLLATPELEMTYYCDTAGRVPLIPKVVTGFVGLETSDIGNGDLSPEWGVDLVIRGGTITYGPWADRQRSHLQQAFTPATFFNQKPTPRLSPGDQRVHTALKVFAEFSEGTTMRIPTREASKNWRYDNGDSSSIGGPALRPYGWLDLSLGPNSTFSYVLPMVSSHAGYETLVEVHLDQLAITSSVNYATFLRAETCRIHCSLPAPLAWNEMRTWTISTTLGKPDIALLRDHITLLTDVAKDWTSGPPGEYEHFVPFHYAMEFKISDYALRLFVNDHNIINNPSMVQDNTFIVVRGPAVAANVGIPSHKYRMDVSDIHFRVAMEDIAISMSLPDWNTHSAFLTDHSATFATAPQLNIDGSYRVYAEAHPDNVERLAISVDCHDVVFKMIGWMIRHMFNLRDNYFGTFTHFVTLEEYRHRHQHNLQGDPLELKYRPGKTDVFEVVVTLDLRNGILLLPQETYDCRSAVAFLIPQMQVDLRNHDYFMEMSLNIDPFRVIEMPECATMLNEGFDGFLDYADCIRVQGLEITANRLFGPQPRTATYICIWSIYLGRVVGSVPPSLLQAFARAGNGIGYNFVDNDNSLPPDFSVVLDPDAAFLSVDLHSVDLAVRGQGTAVQLDIPEGVTIRFDDLEQAGFLKHVAVEVPSITVRALAPLFGRAAPWMEVASVDADFSLVIGLSGTDWQKTSQTQLGFIAAQDALTRRCPFLYKGGEAVSGFTGGLYLQALQAPVKKMDANEKHRSPISQDDLEDVADDLSDVDSRADEDQSSSSEDDAYSVYQRLPFRQVGRDRFSAYGAILRLCERAPETALLDRPTFRRLPPAEQASLDTLASSIPPPRNLPSLSARLETFGARQYTKPVARTAVDLTSRRPLRIVLTPVSTQVAADVLSGVRHDTDFEHVMDDLLDDYAGSRGSVASVRFNDLEVRATLPGIQVDSIQDVLRPEEAISIKPQQLDEKGTGSASTVLCTVRLTLDDIAFTCRQKEDAFGGHDEPSGPMPILLLERYFSGSAGQTRLEVFHPPPATHPTRVSHVLPSTRDRERLRPTALDLVIGRCEAHIDIDPSRALVTLTGADSRLDFVDEAAELITGTVWSWRVVHDVAGPLRNRSVERKLFERQLVWSIATSSAAAGVTSFPTFLNRASYLVSRANLRADDGWKTLHHLRHCLRVAHDAVESKMRETGAPPSTKSMLADLTTVVTRWESWGIDAEDLAHTRFLTTLFGIESATPPTVATDAPSATLGIGKPWSLEWRTGRLSAEFSDDRHSDNRLAIQPMHALVSSTGQLASDSAVHIQGRLTVSSVEAEVDRDLIVLIRHILRVRHVFERKLILFSDSLARQQQTSTPDRISIGSTTVEDGFSFLTAAPNLRIDLSFGITSVSAKALADDLEAKAMLGDIALTSSLNFDSILSRGGRRRDRQLQAVTSFTVGHVALSGSEVSGAEEHLLLATELKRISALVGAAGGTVAGPTIDAAAQPSLQVILGSDEVKLRIPRDAVRVYEFVDKWKSSALPEYDTLLSELRRGLEDASAVRAQAAPPSSTSAPAQTPGFAQRFIAKARVAAQLAVPLFSLEVQAIPALKIGYVVRDFSTHAVSKKAARGRDFLGKVECGLLVGAQTVRFIPLTKSGERASNLPSETAFHLPVVRVGAQLDAVPCRRLELLAAIDSVSMKVTAGVIDNILTVQEHFGKDVDELLRVIKSRQQPAPAPVPPSLSRSRRSGDPALDGGFAWVARVALRGFKLGIEGPQAIQWVEAELIEGKASSSLASSSLVLHWEASVKNLALSLALRNTEGSPTLASDRRYRLAFFRLDLSASNAVINLPELPSASVYGDERTPHLHLRLPRVHAVLQPTAIEALGDLVDFFQQEIEDRRTSRKEAVAALQERVVQTIDEIGTDDDHNAMTWLSSCVLSLQMSTIGVAIPLNDDGVQEPAVRLRRSKSSRSRPAFLMTIPSLSFAAQRGSAGYAQITQFALQFVSDFDQGRKEDFEGATHQSLNRVVLPEMKSTMRSPSHGPTLVHSQVSGLEIDLEPSVVAYAFSLVDVYRLSHERFAKFAPQGADTPSPASSCPPRSRATQDTSIKATFEFASGTIRLHTRASAPTSSKRAGGPASRSSPRPRAHRRGQSLNDFGQLFGSSQASETVAQPEIIRLPGTSLWANYQDLVATDDSRLHVDVSIHASNNTLYPSLLPFISDVAAQLKTRALRTPAKPATDEPHEPHVPAALTASAQPPPFIAASPLSTLQITVSLKVDQSRLEISCLPAAEVTARLTWESGGFLLSMSPDTKAIEFGLTVDGVAAGLRHSFSPEDCLSAEAKGIAASIAFNAPQDSSPGSVGLVSGVVIVPDVSAEMNFRHLQDWLCLKAVWLDRMDLGSNGKEQEAPKQPSPSAAGVCGSAGEDSNPNSSASLASIVHVQISKFRFLGDLGQAIGRDTFVADTITARLRWVPNESREFCLAVKKLELVSQGRLAGQITLDGLIFSTRLREQPPDKVDQPEDLLNIQIGLGQIVGNLEYEFRRILVVDSDPIATTVSDDWTRSHVAETAELLLAFHVKMGSFNIIATTATIPVLVSINKRLAAIIEEKGAQADATVAAAGLAPRPSTVRRSENVVAQVASKLASDSQASECPVRIINRLDIELVRIRIAVFPEHFNDGEVFRLDAGSGIRARLVRGVNQAGVINRDLHLFLGFFSIRKVSHRKLSPSQEAEWEVREWYELLRASTERNIFKIGTTEVSMDSTQAKGSRRLRHKFSMLFGGQVDIALNYALLRNLSSLASAYQRKMDQVNATTKASSLYDPSTATSPMTDTPATGQEALFSAATSDTDKTKLTVTEDQLPKAAGSVVSMKQTPLMQAATGDARELEFEAIEMNVHQPKLNLLGDATPPLEWIGLQRDRFPAWIHTGVSGPLEELLISLSSIYQTQLARQKLASRHRKRLSDEDGNEQAKAT